MAGEWRDATFDQLGRIVTGKTPLSGQPEYFRGDIPFVTPTDFDGRRTIDSTERYLTERGADSVAGSRIPARAVMVSCIGSDMGKAAIAGQDCVTNQQINSIIVAAEHDLLFVYYNLTTRKAEIRTAAGGSAQPILNKTAFGKLDILLPPPDEQRAIAHILGTLDDKVELNRRMNETLEAMARALFKSWFIDFDPVRRNAARARNQPSPLAPLPGGEGRHGEHYRGGYDFSGLLESAREMRKQQTPAEEMFWEFVRSGRFMNLKFRRQHQLGDYIADFYCHEHRLVVELDGGIHSVKRKKDSKRDAWMKAREFTVLRFANKHFLDDPESVLRTIAQATSLPSLPPLPLGEGRGEGSVEELDRMFPDSFDDSELGDIPSGWEVKYVGDLANVVGGTTPSTKNSAYWDGGTHAWATPKDLASLSVPVLLDTERRITAAGLAQIGSGLLPRGTVLLSSRAPIGYLAVAEVPVAINQGFIGMTPKSGTSNLFLLLWAEAAHEEIVSRANGSTFLEISKSNFRPISVVTPQANVMLKFDQLVRPLYKRIVECAREARTLAALRDALLPKLISGELRMKAKIPTRTNSWL